MMMMACEGRVMVKLSGAGLERDLAGTLAWVKDPTAGAVSSFLGTTRDFFEGKEVVTLEYEAYGEMAMSKMAELGQSVLEKFDVIKVAILHRVGVVPVMETSVAIYVSSCHRQSSLEAVTYAINTLKATVPIWKKEVYRKTEDESAWKQNKEFTKTVQELN